MEGTLSENYTYIASGDLSNLQWHIMTNRSGRFSILANSSGADVNIIGVLQNKPKNGEHASVGRLGRGKITVAGSLGANAYFTSNASGRATVAASGDMIVGRLTESATADGDVVDALYLVTSPVRGAVA